MALINQTARDWPGTAVLRRVAVDGAVLAEARLPFTAAARAVATVPVPRELCPPPSSDKELLTVEADGLRALWFAARDKDFAYPAPRWDVAVAAAHTTASATAAADDGDTDGAAVTVTVTARTLLRDLLLQADRLAPTATADRGLTTLLPGESVTITVRGWERPTAAAAVAALFCVNSAVRPPNLIPAADRGGVGWWLAPNRARRRAEEVGPITASSGRVFPPYGRAA